MPRTSPRIPDRLQQLDLELRLGLPDDTLWVKSALAGQGHPDLRFLPQGRHQWNGTLAALSFSQQRRRGDAELNRWAAMHGARPSARRAELGDEALVLFHGTSRERAERIREVGLFHKRGLWTTRDPRIAHGYSRDRAQCYAAGSAMIVLVLDRSRVRPGVHYEPQGKDILRFHGRIDAEQVEYICWPDRVVHVGEAAASEPKAWGKARFKREDGRWYPVSRPPVRLDEHGPYRGFDEWLRLSLVRIVDALGRATAIELLSSLYATLDPWEALGHEQALGVAAELFRVRRVRGGIVYERRPDSEVPN